MSRDLPELPSKLGDPLPDLTESALDDAVPMTELASVRLTVPSRGQKRGDVLEVSAERAAELVAAGLAKRAD